MAPTIPTEIWLRTAQFLPPSYLRNLYPVNSVFLDLALNERYRDVNLNVIWIDTKTTRRLEHLSQPYIAHRVRRLTLASDWSQSNCYIYLSHVKEITFLMAIAWPLPGYLGQFIHPTARNRFLIGKCNARMERMVVGFPNLSSLIIVEGCGTTYQIQPSTILINAYNAYASNLRTLDLVANTVNLTPLFPPHPSELTSLEEVTFSFSPPYFGRTDFKSASKFFQAIASTLTTLNISFRDTTNGPSQLLQSIPCQGGKAAFPKLTNLSLIHSGLPPTDAQSPALLPFLNKHADTLKHLRLQLPNPSLYASQSPDGLTSVAFPQLETLDVQKSDSFWDPQELASHEGLDVVRAYIQHSASTLTHLNLTLCSFTLHDLGILLDLLTRGSSEAGRLNTLAINLQVLSPQVLDTLAEKLPQLEKLTVGFAHLRSNDDADVPPWPGQTGRARLKDVKNEDVESFNLEMQTRSYSRWRLRSFGIDRGPLLPEAEAMAILMPLTRCIPHSVEINAPILIWRELGGSWSLRDSEIW